MLKHDATSPDEEQVLQKLSDAVQCDGLFETGTILNPGPAMVRIFTILLTIMGLTPTTLPDIRLLNTDRIPTEHGAEFVIVKKLTQRVMDHILSLNFTPHQGMIATRHGLCLVQTSTATPNSLGTTETVQLQSRVTNALQLCQRMVIRIMCSTTLRNLQATLEELKHTRAKLNSDLDRKLLLRSLTVNYNRILKSLISKSRSIVLLDPK